MQTRSPKPKQQLHKLAIRRKTAAISIDLRILILRRQRVILDTALADLYNVPVKRLNEQAKRNRKRFPADFMFQLTPRENKSLRSQFATSNLGRGGWRSLPYAFTEHGAIMAATVLNSGQAVEMSVFVVRAFVRLREALAAKPRTCRQDRAIGRTPGDARWHNSRNHQRHQEVDEPATPSLKQDRIRAHTGPHGVVAKLSPDRAVPLHVRLYFMRLRYRLPSTCRTMASMSSGTCKKAVISSATAFGSRSTRW